MRNIEIPPGHPQMTLSPTSSGSSVLALGVSPTPTVDSDLHPKVGWAFATEVHGQISPRTTLIVDFSLELPGTIHAA